MSKLLSAKQRQFIEEFLVDLNATQAAIRAGYASDSANIEGARLLANASIRAAIEERLDKRREMNEDKVQRIVRELENIAYNDPRDLVTWADGSTKLTPSDELTPEQARMVQEIQETRIGNGVGGTVKIKLMDRMKALELLGKYHGMFVDRVAVSKDESPLDVIRAKLEEE